jgi:hypothetical protein
MHENTNGIMRENSHFLPLISQIVLIFSGFMRISPKFPIT